MAQEHLAITRDSDTAAVAFEYGNTKLAFQFTDCFGDSRLTDMKDCCCLHHAFLTGDFQKSLKVAKFDTTVDHGIS